MMPKQHESELALEKGKLTSL